MISGIGVSAYSTYSGQTEAIFGSARVSDVKNNQKAENVENKQEQDDIEDTVSISDEAKRLLSLDKADDSDKLPAEKKVSVDDNKDTEVNKLPAELKTEKKETKNAEPDQIIDKKVDAKEDKKDDKTHDTKLKKEGDLSSEEQQEVQQLKERDTEVRAHEQAHIAAAAGLRTSAPTYDYETGPDGKKYAVGGEVNISFTSGSNPEEDIRNAETMRNAALAPSEPSGQDRSVAKEAEKIIQQAKEKLAEQQEQQKEQITNSENAKTLVGAGSPIKELSPSIQK